MQKVIIDTDTGVDDSWAIMLALATDDLEILGFTSVFGNIESEQAATNLLHILKRFDRRDIPVYLGSEGPVLPEIDVKTGARKVPTFPGKRVHGEKGLGSYRLPETIERPHRNAVQWLVKEIMKSDGDVDIVALGPLTNIALASLIEPCFAKRVNRLILMGGVTDGSGNVLPLSTANIWNDPEAAQIVFHAGFREIVMVGQDVTRDARVTKEHECILGQNDSEVGEFLLAISDTYANEYAILEPDPSGYPLHDLVAVSYLIDEEAFNIEKLYVTVETQGRITRGQTVADRRQTSPYAKQMTVCVGVDLERVFKTFFDHIKQS